LCRYLLLQNETRRFFFFYPFSMANVKSVTNSRPVVVCALTMILYRPASKVLFCLTVTDPVPALILNRSSLLSYGLPSFSMDTMLNADRYVSGYNTGAAEV